MIDWIYPAILIGGGLIVISVMTSLIAFRFGAPLLLIFLGLGLLVGGDGLGLEFDDFNSAYFIGSLALAVILFDSGFGTSIKSFRRAAAPSIVLATIGVLLTTGIVGAAAVYILDLRWAEGLLVGAIVSSTDAAAVFFLLRVGGIRIRDKVRSTLEVESGSNDPMAIFLTITLVELLVSGGGITDISQEFVVGFAMQMGLGLVAGLGGGFLIVQLVNRIELEGALYPILVFSLAICIFALTGAAGGSGALAAYVAGLYAGNSAIRGKAALKRFQDGMTWLAQIAMFLVLGLLATPSHFPVVAAQAIALALVLMFVARPLAVFLCLAPFSFNKREVLFVSWVGLRGAVSILLAIVPLMGGLENGGSMFNVAFIIVLTSLLIQGWTISPLAKWLGLVVPDAIGPVERVGLELPGSANHELIVYRIVAGSPVLEGERLPRWARPSLVVRDGQSMRFQYAGRLREGDYVYMFISPRLTRLLDRLFASPASVPIDDKDFYGEFKIKPSSTMAALEEAYGIPIPKNTSPDTPIGTFMRDRLGGSSEVGDRLPLGPVELIVREINVDGEISEAGLSIEQEVPRPRGPFRAAGRRLLRLVGFGRRGKHRANAEE